MGDNFPFRVLRVSNCTKTNDGGDQDTKCPSTLKMGMNVTLIWFLFAIAWVGEMKNVE